MSDQTPAPDAQPAPSGTEFRLCGVADLEPDTATRIDIEGHRIAVARVGDDWYAIGDECSHADYSLGEGEVDAEECTLECWKHGSQFSLETGEPLTLPATQSVPVYPVVVRDNEVFVSIGTESEGTT